MQTGFNFAANAPGTGTDVTGLLALADTLQQDGRVEDALLLLEHVTQVAPRDANALRQLAVALTAEGRSLEAMAALSALKSIAVDMDSVVLDIKATLASAITRFNAHLAANEIEPASALAEAMATLVPRNAAIVDAALSCAIVRGDADAADRHARILLATDPDHVRARAVLGEIAEPHAAPPAKAGQDDIEQRIEQALQTSSGTHPLVRLRDLHDAASAILCQPLSGRGMMQIERLLAAATQIDVPVPPDSEWAAWEKHYRLLLDTIDLPALFSSAPDLPDDGEDRYVHSNGSALAPNALAELAHRAAAECVFFVAADRHYVDLYARLYARSVLAHCDVPALIIVHVIGGTDSLPEIAKSIGIDDPRLIFGGDRFDATAITTQCFDTPPRGRIEKPVAHLQSVRFLKLGRLLRTLERPIFVSDIDLLLQRGVADLLERARNSDIMLNENEISSNAGSRLTANLLLMQPTPNATLFLRFLRFYLTRMLARPEVTRWIDQCGLLFARHHLMLKGKTPKIGYFDTTSDINNVMYPSYRDNPFRFLSLYHGFDMSSLEPKPASGAVAA